MKKWFKLTKVKRLIALGTTLFVAFLTIILGSVFYLGKPGNVKLSPEYGGSAEFLITIKPPKGQTAANIAEDVAQNIYDRLNPLSNKGIEASAETFGDDAIVRVTYPGVSSEKERTEIQNEITHKPKLVLMDIYGNPLFTNSGSFNSRLKGDPNRFIPFSNSNSLKELLYRSAGNLQDPIKTLVPIASQGAKPARQSSGKEIVQIKLKSTDAASAWRQATTYISSLPKGKNQVFAWLDPQVAYTRIYNKFKNDATVMASQNNLNNFIRVGQKPTNVLRKYTIPVAEYLISQATVSGPLRGSSFIIEGNFNSNEATQLARKINYGVSDYRLSSNLTLNQQTASYGINAFKMAMIAGIIVFAIIAIILMVNYGLLGALSTISVGLFIFLTLMMFTVMRGEYSPSSIAALVIGIGMSVDVVIVTFERLKSEIYSGSSLNKAYKISQRKSFTTIFDSNLTTLIVATVLFYFGTRSIIGLSVTLILSIIFTMLIMLILTRFLSTLLVRSNLINNHKWLLGLKPKFDVKVQNGINKMDYMKNAKWFSLFSFVIMISGFVVFVIFSSMGGSFGRGFNLSQEFTGGISISAKGDVPSINSVRNILMAQPYNIASADIKISGNELTAQSISQFTNTQIEGLKGNIGGLVGNTYSVFRTTTSVANKIVQDALIAVLVAMAFIVVYTVLRFKWTYSIASLIALVHDALIVLLFFVIFRIKIEPVFIAAILTIIGYSINDTIVTFDRVREKMTTHVGVKDKKAIATIANEAVKDTLKRSVLTSLTTIIAIVVLMSFGNATKLEYNIAMLIGLVSGTYSSIFIATWIWVRLEAYRQNRIRLREKNGFWRVKGLEEQTIKGINDFVA